MDLFQGKIHTMLEYLGFHNGFSNLKPLYIRELNTVLIFASPHIHEFKYKVHPYSTSTRVHEHILVHYSHQYIFPPRSPQPQGRRGYGLSLSLPSLGCSGGGDELYALADHDKRCTVQGDKYGG